MAIATVQTPVEFNIGSHAPSIVRAYASSTTTGSLLVITICGAGNRTVSSVTGLATWTQLHYISNGTEWTATWAGICTSSGTNVTVTLSANDANTSEALYEFSGGADPLDEGGTSTEINLTAATGFTLGDVTPDQADSVFICAGRLNGSISAWTKDAAFTEVQFPDFDNLRAFSEYLIQSGGPTADGFTASWTTARNVVASLVNISGSGAALDPIRLVWRQ